MTMTQGGTVLEFLPYPFTLVTDSSYARSMRRAIAIFLCAFAWTGCSDRAEKSEPIAEITPIEAATIEPRSVPAQRPTAVESPAVIPPPEFVPPSPFLVVPKPDPVPNSLPTLIPPPLPVPAPAPLPPPPRTWPTATNTWGTNGNSTGKPCPQGKCLLHGRCIIPGGPIGRPGDPPDVVSGACGGDGGPCSLCRCIAAQTLISTPAGDRPIDELRSGDQVWSVHQGRVEAVSIVATQKVRVSNHSMARIELRNGLVVEMSLEHPIGDGRHLWDLQPNDVLGTAQITSLSIMPYEGSFTFDILPDSDTGTYFIHGLWIGSTMFGQLARGDLVDSRDP